MRKENRQEYDTYIAEKPTYEFLKRIMDVLFSAYSLIFLLPILMIVAVCFKLYDGGSIFEKQEYIGRNRKVFAMYFFRTVYKKKRTESSSNLIMMSKFLKAAGFDKIPQLINILKGDMTIVGPKPDLASSMENLDEHQLKKYLVKPGLTCYWEAYKYILQSEELKNIDVEYVNKRSFFEDLKLICNSIILTPKLQKTHEDLSV